MLYLSIFRSSSLRNKRKYHQGLSQPRFKESPIEDYPLLGFYYSDPYSVQRVIDSFLEGEEDNYPDDDHWIPCSVLTNALFHASETTRSINIGSLHCDV